MCVCVCVSVCVCMYGLTICSAGAILWLVLRYCSVCVWVRVCVCCVVVCVCRCLVVCVCISALLGLYLTQALPLPARANYSEGRSLWRPRYAEAGIAKRPSDTPHHL